MRAKVLPRAWTLFVLLLFAGLLCNSSLGFEHIKGIKKLRKLAKLGLVVKVLAPTVIPIPLLVERSSRNGGGGYGSDGFGAGGVGGGGGGYATMSFGGGQMGGWW